MMRKLSLYLFLITFSFSVTAQSCLPNDTYLYSQADIDHFFLNNPNCDSIAGNLMIMGADITNLYGLQNITTFEKGLWIEDCPLLEDFGGLEKVRFIGDYLEIGFLPLVENFNELGNLTHVGGALDILFLPALTNLDGLENVSSSPTHLLIIGNSNLTQLQGLHNIQSISTKLELQNNALLTDIVALQNIDLQGLNTLNIIGNTELSFCHIHNICVALDNGTTSFTVENNKNGCLTNDEISGSCLVSVRPVNGAEDYEFYPNPTKSGISFKEDTPKNIEIYNQIG